MLSRLALLGAKKGPCVSCRGIRRPRLKITGLPEGAEISFRSNETPDWSVGISANGCFLLSETMLEWIEVTCSVSNRNTIVEVISTKAA